MLRLFRNVLKSVDAFKKSQGGTRRLGVSVSVDLEKALTAFRKLAEKIKEGIWN